MAAAWVEMAFSDSGCALRVGPAAKPHLACFIYFPRFINFFTCFIFFSIFNSSLGTRNKH